MAPTPKRARPAADAAVDVADRLHSVAIHLLRRVRREDVASGLPAPRLSALSVVVFRGPLTISQLAAAEQVRPPTITRIVAALEAARLVERQADPSDGRIVRVNATERGAQMLEEGRRRRIELFARELAGLPTADLACLERAAGILERIVGPRDWPVGRA
jgi:DNA-binding MarR family transcriptional regulator